MTLQEFEKTIMPRPWKYLIFDTIDRELSCYTDTEPVRHELETYQPTDVPDVFKLKQTRIAYVDTRYAAKMRLYNYLLKKCGVEQSFGGDKEIGVSKPILNF